MAMACNTRIGLILRPTRFPSAWQSDGDVMNTESRRDTAATPRESAHNADERQTRQKTMDYANLQTANDHTASAPRPKA